MDIVYEKNKLYMDYINELNDMDLIEILFIKGMFAEKLPKIFMAAEFYDEYSLDEKPYEILNGVGAKANRIISFETMRNTGIPRTMHIPNPFAYYNQCIVIIENWKEIKEHFDKNTKKSKYKVSQIHINKEVHEHDPRELYNEQIEKQHEILRGDNKDNFIHKLKLNKKYYIKTDIAKYFDSIYSHSIPWALVGKEEAKKNQYTKIYYNQIDKYTRNLKGGETSGIPIGPYSSNIISEIILTTIDFNLKEQGWEFIRYMDDYICFVQTLQSLDEFLIDLNNELRHFNLHINHSKTKKYIISDTDNGWVDELYMFPPIFNQLQGNYNEKEKNKIKITFKDMERYLTLVKSLAKSYNDFAIVKYAMKIIYDCKLTENAKELYIYEILNLAQTYTYLIPIIDYYVFDKYEDFFEKEISLSGEDLKVDFIKKTYDENINLRNNEAISFLIYYALKYDIDINIKFEDIKKTESCINYIMGYLYSLKFDSKEENKKTDYENLAKELSGVNSDSNKVDDKLYSFQENWLFVYEALSKDYFENEWSSIKRKGVSFINYAELGLDKF